MGSARTLGVKCNIPLATKRTTRKGKGGFCAFHNPSPHKAPSNTISDKKVEIMKARTN